jgi:hypothetical protein
LDNHVGQIMAADFFLVPTATCRLLFVLIIIAHERRRGVHVGVTDHPTAAWTAPSIARSSPWRMAASWRFRRSAGFITGTNDTRPDPVGVHKSDHAARTYS